MSRGGVRISALLLALVGGLLFAAAGYFAYRPSPFRLYRGQGLAQGTTQIEADSEGLPKSVVSTVFGRTLTKVAVECPSTMRVNQSARVHVTVARQTVVTETFDRSLGSHRSGPISDMDDISGSTITRRYHEPLRNCTARLTSAAFDISPASDFKIGDKEPTPLDIHWTIIPKREGRYHLELNVDELLQSADENFSVSRSLRVNNRTQVDPNFRDIPVQVTVYTELGITQWTHQVVMMVMAAIGCLAGYPLSVMVLQRWTGIKEPD